MGVLVVLVSGCTQLTEKESVETIPEKEEPISSQADQILISDLMDRLDNKVMDYEGSYKRERDFHSGSRHSGTTCYTEESNITIEVDNGKILNYTRVYAVEGWTPRKKADFSYYDRSQDRFCHEQIVRKSEYDRISSSLPKLGGTLIGCKFGKGKIRNTKIGSCVCEYGDVVSIEYLLGFPCTEEKNTENMKLISRHVVYYPERGKGFCYYAAKDNATGEFWAFECNQEDVELKPLVNNLENLSNVKCYITGVNNQCTCEFDPVNALFCSGYKPDDSDAGIKQKIIKHLTNATISSISEEDKEHGHCYNFSYHAVEHSICFNEKNLITFAQWREKRSGESGHYRYDTNKFVKIN